METIKNGMLLPYANEQLNPQGLRRKMESNERNGRGKVRKVLFLAMCFCVALLSGVGEMLIIICNRKGNTVERTMNNWEKGKKNREKLCWLQCLGTYFFDRAQFGVWYRFRLLWVVFLSTFFGVIRSAVPGSWTFLSLALCYIHGFILAHRGAQAILYRHRICSCFRLSHDIDTDGHKHWKTTTTTTTTVRNSWTKIIL